MIVPDPSYEKTPAFINLDKDALIIESKSSKLQNLKFSLLIYTTKASTAPI